MNKTRRKEIARALAMLGDAREILDSIASEERDAFEAMPESLQSSERGQSMESAAETIEQARDNIENIETELQGVTDETA